MKKLVFLLTLLSFITTGCRKDPKVAPYEERQVFVFFSHKSLTNSVLKATAEEEKAVSRVLLFGVAGQTVTKIYDGTPVSDGVKLIISKTITSFYAIANPSVDLAAATPTNLTALKGLTESFLEQPENLFLMSGSANINGSINVNIQLERAVAKIKIDGINDFVITSVDVENTPSRGYVFPQDPFVVPGGNATKYKIFGDDPIFYVAENTTVSPTRFIVTGIVDSKVVTYPISQLTKNNGTPVDIKRNCYYEITVSPTTEHECTFTIEIKEWTPVEVDGHVIPDE